MKALSELKNETSRLKEFLVSHPLSSYFIMAFLFSWLCLIPYILWQWGILPKSQNLAIFHVANVFVGPMLSAYIMIRTLEGKEAWKNIRKSIWQVRIGLKWYIFALLVIPAVMYIGMVIVNSGAPEFEGLSSKFFVTYPIYLVVVFFGGGPFPEEIGWRGFALPRMQKRFGALKATLLLGLLWACWHLPQFLTSAQHGGPGTHFNTFATNFPIFIVCCIAISIILTWIYNKKQGNLFSVMLVHASINTFSMIQPYATNPSLKDMDVSFMIVFVLLALIALISTRGKLGYDKNSYTVLAENVNAGR
ncbi:CAAX amino terminal protease family protein [Neobacillus vireti LMG 21834]|uniref:CAAX amino terminal protease family protein n=1 Tax=Neobacillus vireti LMG 21834 TaxID=1131730 RepID=A0AB94IGM3_9BACI|nr:CAAX amino terminal protease family protein [Neobacillus vireti LMG 21834]